MTSFEESHSQNHRITELSNVLNYLVKDRSMCDTDTCRRLFRNYLSELTSHTDLIERQIYPIILKNGDSDADILVNNFINGSQEIKRIIKQYKRNWFSGKSKVLKIDDHSAFTDETDRLFDLVLDRLQDETEHLYPLARSLQQA